MLLSEAILSSSAIPVTVAPLANANDVDDANAPEVVNVPSTIVFSFMLIVDESDESSVVPFTLKALIKTSPVPLGWIERSAFEPLDEIVFVVTAPIVAVPVIVGALIVGDVKTLFVSVCDPVSVVTVESIANVTVLPDPDVSIPVPPVKVIVSESKSIDNAPPESAWKSRSSAVICASTYAFIDCCVAKRVALSLAMLSSSAIPVTVAPEANAKLVDDANAPETVNVPSTIVFSFILIVDESDESNVVPFTLKELNMISPVPLGWIFKSAFDPLDVIEFVVIAPGLIVPVNVPLKVPPLIVGLVNVLFVKVCVAVKPTVAVPPAVDPSCTLKVFKVVSTVISPAAPVKALFCVVFPLLNCSVVGIICSYFLYLLRYSFIMLHFLSLQTLLTLLVPYDHTNPRLEH